MKQVVEVRSGPLVFHKTSDRVGSEPLVFHKTSGRGRVWTIYMAELHYVEVRVWTIYA
jgi:hypothetical protein